MNSLVIYFYDENQSTDLEVDGKVIRDVEYGYTLAYPGFRLTVTPFGDIIDEDLEMGVVEVGTISDDYVEYLFTEFDIDKLEVIEFE